MKEDILEVNSVEFKRTEIARRYIDSAEAWLRRIVHFELSKTFGENYFREGIVKSDTRRAVEKIKKQSPHRFSRDIDATSFEQVVDIVTNHEHYRAIFCHSLSQAYPDGPNEAKTFMHRLITARNMIQHGNGCSSRQLEQAICYTNDIIDSLKKYFADINMERAYNVPTIIKFRDNQGRSNYRENMSVAEQFLFMQYSSDRANDLRPGDNILLEIDVDPTFDPSTYSVQWWAHPGNYHSEGNSFQIIIREENVSLSFQVGVQIVSNKKWHLHGAYDDQMIFTYRVLPPL